jgi:HAD superfamily phosphatase (TIGR01668 family)
LRFLKRFLPREQVAGVTSIDLEALRARGIELLLIDLDNTLLGWKGSDLSEEITHWMASVHAVGFSVCLVSNAAAPRLRVQAQRLNVDYVPVANKPSRRGLRKAMKRFRREAAQTAMIGDQIFADVWAGNRLGIYTILVVPLLPEEQWWMRLVRRLERWVLVRLRDVA